MALEEFTGFVIPIPWSLSGITSAGRFDEINDKNAKKVRKKILENLCENILRTLERRKQKKKVIVIELTLVLIYCLL